MKRRNFITLWGKLAAAIGLVWIPFKSRAEKIVSIETGVTYCPDIDAWLVTQTKSHPVHGGTYQVWSYCNKFPDSSTLKRLSRDADRAFKRAFMQ